MKYKSSRTYKSILSVATMLMLSTGLTWAQLVTSDLTVVTPNDLAASLVGPGVSIHNVAYTGSGVPAGLFAGGTGIIGFEDGIILGSGDIGMVVGPNTSGGTSVDLGAPGDADLTALAGYSTWDATVLEFDFVPNRDHIYFKYVFASEEYNEYVFSGYNDVFAFLVNGVNCAVVGEPPVPVSVNTINNGYNNDGVGAVNPAQYINNDTGALDTEMDGLTVVLTCDSAVTPFATNHMKLAIADAGDQIFDSNIFIQFGSLTTVDPDEYVCPLSHGYWKNHLDVWPVSDLYLGDLLYGTPALLELLGAPTRGDASKNLAKQLIAAKLNIENGSNPDPVADAVDEADTLIGANVLPMGVRSKTALGHDMNQVKDILDDYNNGLMTTNCITVENIFVE